MSQRLATSPSLPPLRETLQQQLLAGIPRALSLLDKNPYSPTYGSFDRKYWHYKILDFPCGMQQELALPVAYCFQTSFQGNRYQGLSRLREHLVGMFRFHARASHPDGSLDDYFPHERAIGATAYALAALSEAALLTGLCPAEVMPSFEKSAAFLAGYREAGTLSNHTAISAMALTNVARLTGNSCWEQEAGLLEKRLIDQQHPEGWFPEYEGCDLGYQTTTVEFLARRYHVAPSARLLDSLTRCVRFLRAFVHPDGSLGGEYGSRNTYNFYPGGFALLSPQIPEAAEILGAYLAGSERGTLGRLDDDGVFGHMLSSHITVLRASGVRSEKLAPPPEGGHLREYPGAGLFAGTAGRFALYGSTTKGGVLKVFDGDRLAWSDTGFVGTLADGTPFCQNKAGTSLGKVAGNTVEIEGSLRRYSVKRLTRVQMVGLRALSLVFGRFRAYSNFIRLLMQKVLIYDRHQLTLRFQRRVELSPSGVRIRDRLLLGGAALRSLHRSPDCVNMHVITSDSFQEANLLAWEELPVKPAGDVLEFERCVGQP